MNTESAALVLLEDLRRARYYLRRYAGGSKCPSNGYHNVISRELIAENPEEPGSPYTGTCPPEVDHADPRWPANCPCGYAFVESDTRQIWAEGLYRLPNGTVVAWKDAPAGSIINADWWPSKGPDGKAWNIKLPDRTDWMTETKASNCQCPGDPAHRCWTRSGVAPKLTVMPSIATGNWHGWLRDGVLVSC